MAESLEVADGLKIWPWLWLRGAGFSSELVGVLAAVELSSAVETLLALEQERQKVVASAIDALDAALEQHEGRARKPLTKAILKLRKGLTPTQSEDLGGAKSVVERLQEIDLQVAQAKQGYEESFSLSLESLRGRLAEVATEPRFREAVAWQNVRALRSGVDKLADGSSEVKHQRLVANYLQRYCCKNDTIGFFGPISWGHIVEGPSSLKAGPDLLAGRRVYFSSWSMQRVAEALSDSEALRPALYPRLRPTARVQGQTLVLGDGKQVALPPDLAWILAHATGASSARDLAATACSVEELELEDEEQVLELLEQLEEKGLLSWRLEVPGLGSHPELHIRRQLERAGQAGAEGLAALNELEEQRGRLAAAAGDADATAEALEALASSFERITGASAHRNAGRTYGARTTVFEDCVRDVEFDLSSTHLRALGPALRLVCTSARWCSFEIARRYRVAFDEVFDAFGEASVSYLQFFEKVSGLLPTIMGERDSIVDEVMAELKSKWTSALQWSDGAREHRVSSDSICQRISADFQSPGPGWPNARFHCPDLLFASEALDAEGEFLTVLGEIHACGLSVFSHPFTQQFPEISEAVRAYEKETQGHIEVVIPSERTTRASGYSMSPRDMHVEMDASISPYERSKVLPAAELIVRRDGDFLSIASRDGAHSFDVIAFFEYIFAAAVQARFDFFEQAAHAPRVVVDQLVIARESWEFDSSELGWRSLNRGPAQFLAFRAWAAGVGLPRYVFAKCSNERKPFFVDLMSPILVELLCVPLRQSETVRFTEMLPGPGQHWLTDAEERHYTSELRTVLVDSATWQRS